MRYVMKQKLFAWGDDFIIKDEAGNERYYVDGKVFALGNQLSFQDMDGNELAFIRQKLLSWGPTYEIYIKGELYAVVKKHLFTFFSCAFTVDVPGPDDIEAKGNFLDKDYTFYRFDGPIAQVSKKWFSFTDSYGVDVHDERYALIVLASTVVIDMCCHDKKD